MRRAVALKPVFRDVDDERHPIIKCPKELISTLREARRLAKKYGGDITDGQGARIYTKA
jgi:hypothetical protein